MSKSRNPDDSTMGEDIRLLILKSPFLEISLYLPYSTTNARRSALSVGKINAVETTIGRCIHPKLFLDIHTGLLGRITSVSGRVPSVDLQAAQHMQDWIQTRQPEGKNALTSLSLLPNQHSPLGSISGNQGSCVGDTPDTFNLISSILRPTDGISPISSDKSNPFIAPRYADNSPQARSQSFTLPSRSQVVATPPVYKDGPTEEDEARLRRGLEIESYDDSDDDELLNDMEPVPVRRGRGCPRKEVAPSTAFISEYYQASRVCYRRDDHRCSIRRAKTCHSTPSDLYW